mmetsp:Transcript_7396/g.19720  ORF Transcript_7396/g.19720 Transcript_7396/m.19720 type:complete len:246 (-) Transcript_7396:31-768(-)
MFSDSSPPSLRKPTVSAMGPGARLLTRTLYWPHSLARCVVSPSMAALAAPACAWKSSPFQCSVAVMLMMEPPCCFIYILNTACDSKKQPVASMSSTVRHAFADSFSAGQRKLPAAPLTRTSMRPKRSSAARTAAATASWDRTSICTAKHRAEDPHAPAAALSRSLAPCTTASRRLPITTSQPCRMRTSEMRKQIPVPPPLTIATRPRSAAASNALSYSARHSISSPIPLRCGARCGARCDTVLSQ